jgi:hypothetical protein
MSESPSIGMTSGNALEEMRDGASAFPGVPNILINSVSGAVMFY